MRLLTRSLLICAVYLAATISPPAARADSPDRDIAKFASGAGSIAYLAAGVGLPLVHGGKEGRVQSARATDALLVSVICSEGLKGLTRVKRPDSTERDSFPSGHATAAFAVATMESQFHPRQAVLWYAGAALISASRLTLHRHTFGEVVAGAALGYGVARLELSMRRGLLLQPWIPPNRSGVGLQLSARF